MYRQAVGISAALLLVVGCGSGGGQDLDATSTTAAAATTTAAGEPVGLDVVRQALQRTTRSTGRLTERLDHAIGPDTVGFSSATVFDGTSGNREVVRTVMASNPEVLAMMTDGASVEDLEIRVRYLDGVLYLNTPGAPAERRDRWLRFTSEDTGAVMAEAGLTLDGNTSYPSRLLALIDGAEPTALRSAAADGATGYRLTVPAPLAASALETRTLIVLTDAGHDGSDLTGTAALDLVVGADGTIASATMDATGLFVQILELTDGQGSGDTSGVRLLISMEVGELGVPFTVEAPPENLVDDA